jgi:hypothetical protein
MKDAKRRSADCTECPENNELLDDAKGHLV